MKKLTKSFQSKTVSELEKEEKKLREEIGKLRLEWKVNPPKDTNAIFKKRKELAVILTVISQKKELEKLKK